MRSQQVFKSKRHVGSTIQMTTNALSNNHDKRMIGFNRITTHAYGSNVGKICKNKLLTKVKRIDRKK